MTLRRILFTILAFSFTYASAQEFDNTASYKQIDAERYIRLSLDNDFVVGTDQQYTEGFNLEIVSPGLKKFPLTRLLVNPHFETTTYGIGIEQAAYTPANLRRETYHHGDRPYSGVLFLKTSLTGIDPIHKQRFSTTLNAGVLGPAALGKEIQGEAHVVLNDVIPPGWKHQLHNDIILNYQFNYEKQVFAYKNLISLDAGAMARMGTLSNKISPGMTLMIGNFASPFSGAHDSRNDIRFYVYEHPQVDFVGYEATLQGGVFSNSSPYVIPAKDISRIVFNNRAGITFASRRLLIEYYLCFRSRQFIAGSDHMWSGMQLAYILNGKKSGSK